MLPFSLVTHAVLAGALLHSPEPPPGWSSFVSGLRDFMAADSVAGGGAVLMRDGQVVAHTEIGMADRSARQPVDTLTLYHWASITKTLTAVAIMQLRDRGLLSLDDPVTRWVPELRTIHDPFASIDKVTVRMLLSHSGGFQSPTWPYGNGSAWEPFEPTRWDQLVAMMPYQRVLFEPGTRYRYSNPGFVYLARIIEAITGDPWISHVQKNIWSPLQMHRSYVNGTPWHLARLRANNYTLLRDSAGRLELRENGRDFNPGITIPNGGWNAPMADLATWAAFLTGARCGAAATCVEPLARESLLEMWRPVVRIDDSTSMGLSFFLTSERGRTLVYHTGEQAGFRSILMFDPSARTALVVNVNTVNYADEDASARRWNHLLRQAAGLLAGWS